MFFGIHFLLCFWRDVQVPFELLGTSKETKGEEEKQSQVQCHKPNTFTFVMQWK